MRYDFEVVKKEFMQVRNSEEWNEIREKYPEFRFDDMDHEMKMHMNKILSEMASKEQRDNPNIHYEVKKTNGQ
ncbi:MAG: hypothetical protein ACI4TK_05190 [Agathobacter sp.]